MTDFDIFCDAGLGLVSPSPHCGSWAWCFVAGGEVVREASGVVTPDEAGVPRLSSNVMELLAAIRALESAPDGWSGILHSDSRVTLARLTARRRKVCGLPDCYRLRLRRVLARFRLNGDRVLLLKGHPSAADLRRGHKNGVPVSPYNKRCDDACRTACADFLHEKGIV